MLNYGLTIRVVNASSSAIATRKYGFILEMILIGGIEVMTLLSFLISLVPFLELRFSIPLAMLFNPTVSPVAIFAICVLLNLLAIPIGFFLLDFIIPPIRRRVKFVDRIFLLSVKRARKYQNISLIGLALFVGVPLPATGAYTGTLIAYVGGFDRRLSSLAIAVGVVIAGVAMWALATIGIIFIQGLTPS